MWRVGTLRRSFSIERCRASKSSRVAREARARVMQANAAGALSDLARTNEENQALVARERGIPPLVTLLADGSADGREQAAAAL